MKKNFIYALMSAIALTGAVGFSSCSSTEEPRTLIRITILKQMKSLLSLSLMFLLEIRLQHDRQATLLKLLPQVHSVESIKLIL